MYHLATIFPKLEGRKLPLSRDQIILLLAAVNEIILGVDIFLAHSISGTIVPYEWIPIIFGPLAGILLLISGIIAMRRRDLATNIASLVFVASIIIGVLGTYFHFRRALLQDAQISQIISLDLMINAVPLFGPISFAGVGLLGLSAALVESPPDSGKLRFFGGGTLRLPYSKSSAYYFYVSLGILAALISSVLDHARTGFANPWLWLPTLTGVFAVVVAVVIGANSQPTRNDLLTFFYAMLVLMIVGLIGAALHVQTDLTANFKFVQERFLRGAPVLAPLQFANMALLGIVIMLDPKE
ncbi:MAG: hypothetical protein N2D54_05935 [Chloroflexota bacterium]